MTAPPIDRVPFIRRALWDEVIVTYLPGAPVSQISERVRARLREFVAREIRPSDAEVYDFMASIAKEPCPTEISSFVRSLCDVERFYLRPEAS